ncbi:MAG: hypothetical protein KIS92_24915 [Planctomycetota bacterium]|nr:hypothetical protein [Planctomycetota bacterium]
MRGIAWCAFVVALASWTLAAQDEDDEPKFQVPENLSDPFVLQRAPRDADAPKDKAWRQRDLARMDGASNAADAARALLAEGKAREALERCNESLKALGEVEHPEALDAWGRIQGVAWMREDLLRIREAAQRQAERQEAEAAFQRLNLLVSGIMVGETRANAVVNGKVVSAGETLALNGEDAAVRIEEIRREMVVVSFRGLKMPVALR